MIDTLMNVFYSYLGLFSLSTFLICLPGMVEIVDVHLVSQKEEPKLPKMVNTKTALIWVLVFNVLNVAERFNDSDLYVNTHKNLKIQNEILPT